MCLLYEVGIIAAMLFGKARPRPTDDGAGDGMEQEPGAKP
jgi:hypothetical protein